MKTENRKTDGRNTFFAISLNTVSGIISILVSLLVTIYITRLLSASDIGIATSFLSLKNILCIVCLLSISSSINRMLLSIKNNKYEYLSTIYIISSCSCILLFIIYYIFHGFLNLIFGFDLKIMTLMFCMIFCVNGVTILDYYLIYHNKYKTVFVYNILSSPVSQLISVLLVVILSSNKYMGRIIGVEVFNVILGIICGIYILYKGKFKLNLKYAIESLKICLPLIPHLLAQVLLTSCDLIIIKNIVGNDAAGVYGMSYNIAYILFAILIQFFNPWSPWVYRRIENNEVVSIRKYSKFMMLISWTLCIGLITVAPEMISMFLPAEYSAASIIIPPLCAGIFFETMYIFYYDIQYYYKKNIAIAIVSVFTAILNIVLNLVYIKKFGYVAAAYTTLISYIIMLILHFALSKKNDKRRIYDDSLLAILSIILIIVVLSFVVTNNNIIVRYSTLIIAILTISVLYGKEMFYSLKSFLLDISKKG